MNITKETERYINEHPSIKDCLKKGLINYSALSRDIAKELEVKNIDAILIACRRYKRKLKSSLSGKKIIEVLKDSKLEIKNKLIAVIIESDVYSPLIVELEKIITRKKEAFHIIQGSRTITLVTSEEFLKDIKKIFKNKIIKINEDLVEVIVKSTEKIETTPGVMAYLYSLFADAQINIIETMSTWTDTLFLIDKKDVSKVMDILRF